MKKLLLITTALFCLTLTSETFAASTCVTSSPNPGTYTKKCIYSDGSSYSLNYAYINGGYYGTSKTTTNTDGSSTSITYQYDKALKNSFEVSRIVTYADGSSMTKTSIHDSNGKFYTTSKTTTDTEGKVTQTTYEYDSNYTLISYAETSYDENGNSCKNTYDADGNLIATHNYDSNGNLTGYTETSSDKYGNTCKNTYDANENLTASVCDLVRTYTLQEAYAATADNSTNTFLVRYH